MRIFVMTASLVAFAATGGGEMKTWEGGYVLAGKKRLAWRVEGVPEGEICEYDEVLHKAGQRIPRILG